MFRRRSLFVLMMLLSWSARSYAQSTGVFPEPSPTEAVPVPPTVPSAAPDASTLALSKLDRSVWDARFNAARGWLEQGQFARAASEFAELARTSPTAPDRMRALDFAQLAYNWEQRGLTLVERMALVGSDIEAKNVDKRTADEIGVLYTTSVIYGLGTGAWLDVEAKMDTGAAIFTPLLIAGAAAGGVALLDSGRGLRYGVAQSIASGMYIGLWQGIGWTTYLQASTQRQNQLSGEQYATALWGSATLGAVVGGASVSSILGASLARY